MIDRGEMPANAPMVPGVAELLKPGAFLPRFCIFRLGVCLGVAVTGRGKPWPRHGCPLETDRGEVAAYDVDIPLETSRGDAAAYDVDIPWRRVAATPRSTTWIFRWSRVAATPWMFARDQGNAGLERVVTLERAASLHLDTLATLAAAPASRAVAAAAPAAQAV